MRLRAYDITIGTGIYYDKEKTAFKTENACTSSASEDNMNMHDIEILRRLAWKQADYASGSENADKIKRWYRHNEMKGEPMVLAEISGIYDEINLEENLLCLDSNARDIELILRRNIYHHEFIRDDSVIDPYYKIQWHISDNGYGVPMGIKRAEDKEGREWGMEIDPPIKNLENDLNKLHHREFSVDRDSTFRKKSELEALFGDILPVRIYGDYWWTMGLTHHAIYFVGLEQFMMYMYDQPEALHELMEFVYEDRIGMVKWMEREGLLCLNNGNNYIGSGSRGFTNELSQKGAKTATGDMWVLLESQPTGYVSPAMFGEFALDYQLRVAKDFGFVYYGCCEPLHDRMDMISAIPNLRSVSVSPFSNEGIMADSIRNKYIYSRKPDPAMLSMGALIEKDIIESVNNTMKIAGDCEIEFIMKDLHTVRKQPDRLKRWVELTKETIDSF